MHRSILTAGLVVVVVGAAHAATLPSGGKAQYDHCLARASSDPNEALREASEWQSAGGGPASDHCIAVALVALHRYVEAGAKLDTLASSRFAADPMMRMALFDQAGNAWLLASKPDNAIASFTAALAIDPSDADILSDRARANAMKKNWAGADSDLSAALLVNPMRADLLVLRGSARHAMGRKAEARTDYERALKLHPGYVDALVERGNMKYEAGDIAGARTDWGQVVSASPESAAATVARQHLTDTDPASPPANGAPMLKPPKPH